MLCYVMLCVYTDDCGVSLYFTMVCLSQTDRQDRTDRTDRTDNGLIA